MEVDIKRYTADLEQEIDGRKKAEVALKEAQLSFRSMQQTLRSLLKNAPRNYRIRSA